MSFFSDRRAAAIAQVEAWLNATFEEAAPVSGAVRQSHGLPNSVAAWRICAGGNAFILGVDAGFPYSAPQLALLDRPDAQLDPHVEDGMRLCLAGDGARVDADDPIGSVRQLLDEAVALIATNAAGNNAADFVSDFGPYWRRSKTSNFDVRILISGAPPSREVAAWHGAKFVFVADTSEACLQWLEHRFGADKTRRTKPALFAWLEELPAPADYPSDVVELRTLLDQRAPEALPILDRIIGAAQSSAVAILGGPTVKGSTAAAAMLLEKQPEPPKSRGSRGVSRGFRPGRVPPEVMAARWRAKRAPAADVLAARSRRPRSLASDLFDKTVALVGCGSLGSGVARLLAQSGVGGLILVDPEDLAWANIGRHELGADFVGKPKASSLAARLLGSLPHLRYVESFDTVWREWAERHEPFGNADLVISVTGDWNSEAQLSDYHRSIGVAVPLLFGWLEPKAAAAHALLLNTEGPCFRCGFDAVGNSLLPATAWDDLELSEQCAGATSPYGAVDLAPAQALVAYQATSGSDPLATRKTDPPVGWLIGGSSPESTGGARALRSASARLA